MTSNPSPILLIAESAATQMKNAAHRSHPNETGGILLGVENEGHPWVTHIVEFATKERGRHHYRLPGGATQPAVYVARATDPRLGYLGDWHTHPADVGPSTTDLRTLAMHSLRHPLSPNPSLLVVRRRHDFRTINDYDFDARRITAVLPRPCAIRMTGDLPPHDTPTPQAPDDQPNDGTPT